MQEHRFAQDLEAEVGDPALQASTGIDHRHLVVEKTPGYQSGFSGGSRCSSRTIGSSPGKMVFIGTMKVG